MLTLLWFRQNLCLLLISLKSQILQMLKPFVLYCWKTWTGCTFFIRAFVTWLPIVLTMVGRKNGVAARLKRIIPTLLSVHCICHRLALTCADATDEQETFDNVHLWLTQLWKLFDYSRKKSSLLLKVQTENATYYPDKWCTIQCGQDP